LVLMADSESVVMTQTTAEIVIIIVESLYKCQFFRIVTIEF